MNDVLQFYAFSADKKTGEGVGDSVHLATDYDELNKVRNWRRMFSSFWSEDPFIFNNQTYTSFEHAYQASKYVINGYADYAFEFCLESGSQLSTLTGKDVQKAGRKFILSDEQIKRWDEIMPEIKKHIYEAKFTKDSRPGQTLVLTKNTILINAGPRIKRIHCTRLEELRTQIQK